MNSAVDSRPIGTGRPTYLHIEQHVIDVQNWTLVGFGYGLLKVYA